MVSITDIILDRLNETTLFEMAHSRREVRQKVTDLSPQIFDNLVKLFVFDSPQNAPHWRSEIDTWLDQIDSLYLTPDKKKPSKNDLYTWIIFDSAPHYSEEFLRLRIRKWQATTYKNMPLHEFDAEYVLNKILSIINRVCDDMAHKNFISIDDYL